MMGFKKVISYVKHQKEHHKQQTTIPDYEDTRGDTPADLP
jgi:hypothetical protein